MTCLPVAGAMGGGLQLLPQSWLGRKRTNKGQRSSVITSQSHTHMCIYTHIQTHSPQSGTFTHAIAYVDSHTETLSYIHTHTFSHVHITPHAHTFLHTRTQRHPTCPYTLPRSHPRAFPPPQSLPITYLLGVRAAGAGPPLVT